MFSPDKIRHEGGEGGRRPPARAASVPAPQGPRKVGARSAPGFLVANIRNAAHCFIVIYMEEGTMSSARDFFVPLL